MGFIGVIAKGINAGVWVNVTSPDESENKGPINVGLIFFTKVVTSLAVIF